MSALHIIESRMTFVSSSSPQSTQATTTSGNLAGSVRDDQTRIATDPKAPRISPINFARTEGDTELKLAYDGTEYFGSRKRVLGRARENYVDTDVKVEIGKLPTKYTDGLPAATVRSPELTSIIPLSKLEQQDLASLRKKYIETRDSKYLDKYTLLANRARLTESAKYDGEIFLVSTNKPKNEGLYASTRPKEKVGNSASIIFVPGMNETVGRSLSEASDIANATGAKVAMVYHATDGFKVTAMGTSNLFNGGFLDVESTQVQASKGMLSRPKIVSQVARSILAQLDDPNLKAQDIRVMCYSQGTILVGAALEIVEKRILARVGTGPGKISKTQAEQLLGRIKILGIGTAAAHRDFPIRFQKNYLIVNDVKDVISSGRQTTGDTVNPLNALEQARRKKYEPNSSFYHASYWSHSLVTKGAPYNDTVPGIIAMWSAPPVGIGIARQLFLSVDYPSDPKALSVSMKGTGNDALPFFVDVPVKRGSTGRVEPKNTAAIKFD